MTDAAFHLQALVDSRSGYIDRIADGVTVSWLAQNFDMDPSTVRKKLSGCPVLRKKTSGAVYSLPEAAAYLVRPKFDVEAYVRNMKPQDLPPALQQGYWAAQVARQKWEMQAQHLWATDDVLNIFGDVFKRVKLATQLWPETLERMTGLSDEQRDILVTQIDALLDSILTSVREYAADRSTPPSLAKLAALKEIIDDRDDFSDIL